MTTTLNALYEDVRAKAIEAQFRSEWSYVVPIGCFNEEVDQWLIGRGLERDRDFSVIRIAHIIRGENQSLSHVDRWIGFTTEQDAFDYKLHWC